MNRTFEIRYYLAAGNSGQQVTHIQATSVDAARRIFTQQNPGCRISMIKELP